MKRILYFFCLLFLVSPAIAQDFSNPVLEPGKYPTAKNRIDSIINNSEYVFEGKVIDVKGHTGYPLKMSFLFLIENIYNGGEKMNVGTIELIVPYPRAMTGDTTPTTFEKNVSYILFCKKTNIKGIYDANNTTKLELYYSKNGTWSIFYKTYDSYYSGLGCLDFRTKEDINSFLQLYKLTPKPVVQTKLLKTSVYEELKELYGIKEEQHWDTPAKEIPQEIQDLIRKKDSIYKAKLLKSK